MKKCRVIKTSSNSVVMKIDGHLSEEVSSLMREVIFEKVSMLEDYYLEGVGVYSTEILRYLRFLRDNITEWRFQHPDWTDVWIREVKPYIQNNFPDLELLHIKRWKSCQNMNLYDRLHEIAKYSDLHKD
jgi:hypothetical protein